MSETLVAPPKIETERVVPENERDDQRVRVTRAMCRVLDDGGLLPERYELLDGVIYTKMPIHPPHRIVLILLGEWLVAVFGYRFVQTENPIVVPGEDGEISEPQPDIAVTLQPTTAYDEGNPAAAEVRLAIEVADTTLERDLNVKAPLYARAGIPEYWVFDILSRQVHRHRLPLDGRYSDIVILSANEMLAVPGREESLRIGDLLPPRREA